VVDQTGGGVTLYLSRTAVVLPDVEVHVVPGIDPKTLMPTEREPSELWLIVMVGVVKTSVVDGPAGIVMLLVS
jgi:hypothetical protein